MTEQAPRSSREPTGVPVSGRGLTAERGPGEPPVRLGPVRGRIFNQVAAVQRQCGREPVPLDPQRAAHSPRAATAASSTTCPPPCWPHGSGHTRGWHQKQQRSHHGPSRSWSPRPVSASQAMWGGWGSNPRPRDYEAGKPGLLSCRLVTFLQVRAGAVCHVISSDVTACRRVCEQFVSKAWACFSVRIGPHCRLLTLTSTGGRR